MQLLGESPDLKKPLENYGSHMRHSVGRHYQFWIPPEIYNTKKMACLFLKLY